MIKRLKTLKPDAIRAGVAAWFRERIDIDPILHFASKKTVPRHCLSGIYLLGGAALFLFMLQVLTGFLLMLYYQPSQATAYASVQRIMEEVPYGWLIRSMHVWGAHCFIGIVLLHCLTVLFTKAYRKPRELTWMTGVSLLFLALAFGFSGYLLPWNELSYYATLVGTEIPGTFPVFGKSIVHFLRGGPQISGDTITRFYAAHVMLLPLTAGGLLTVHLVLLQFQGMSLPLGLGKHRVKDARPFFTEFTLQESCVWSCVLGLIVTLAVMLPAEMGIEADPLKPAPQGIKPEWFFLFMFQTLKHVPELPGVLFFGVAAACLFLLPFLDRKAQREQHGVAVTGLCALFLLYAMAFEIWAISLPGVAHPPQTFNAETYSLSGGVVSLILLWAVLGFIVYQLWQLMRENRRVRRLYDNRDCSLGLRNEGDDV